MANSNLFLRLYEILPIAEENTYILRFFFLFYHEIVCYIYSLESPRRGDSNEYIQHGNLAFNSDAARNYNARVLRGVICRISEKRPNKKYAFRVTL